MADRTTITLDSNNLSFLDKVAAGNRSAYINKLINEEKTRRLAQTLLQANLEEAADKEYQAEVKLWDTTLLDGLK